MTKDYTEIKKQYFNELCKKDSSIVDYGGGTGKLLKLLNFNKKYIIDIKKQTDEFEFYTPNTFKNKVDVVLLSMTLHHIKNLENSLNEINNILNEDGILIIRESDCNSISLIKIHNKLDLKYYNNFDNIVINHQSQFYWEKLLSKYFRTEAIIYEKGNPYNVFWQKFIKKNN